MDKSKRQLDTLTEPILLLDKVEFPRPKQRGAQWLVQITGYPLQDVVVEDEEQSANSASVPVQLSACSDQHDLAPRQGC